MGCTTSPLLDIQPEIIKKKVALEEKEAKKIN